MGSHETPSNLSCVRSVLMVLIIIEKSLVFVLKSKTLEMKLQAEEILINLSDNTHINRHMKRAVYELHKCFTVIKSKRLQWHTFPYRVTVMRRTDIFDIITRAIVNKCWQRTLRSHHALTKSDLVNMIKWSRLFYFWDFFLNLFKWGHVKIFIIA